jgi:hypothetical protein
MLTFFQEFLPGKRSLAMGLCIYHTMVSTILFQAPRFIPHSFGPLMEQYVDVKLTCGSFAHVNLQLQGHTGGRVGRFPRLGGIGHGDMVAGDTAVDGYGSCSCEVMDRFACLYGICIISRWCGYTGGIYDEVETVHFAAPDLKSFSDP